jgi:opacity protein-like surface antigen
MKKMLFGAVAAMFVAGAAMANDFTRTEAFVDVNIGKFSFGVEGRDGQGFSQLEFDYEVFNYAIGSNGDSALDLGITYYDLGETVTLDATYEAVFSTGPNVDLYGSAEVNYIASSQVPAIEGDWFVTPELGIEVFASDVVSVFADVEYGFNVTNSARDEGGNVEFGVNWVVADNITVTPSMLYYYDRQFTTDRTEARVGLTLEF